MFIVWTHLNRKIKNELSIFLLPDNFQLRDRNVATFLKLTYFWSTSSSKMSNYHNWGKTLCQFRSVKSDPIAINYDCPWLSLGWCEFYTFTKAYVCHGSWWDVTQPLYFPIFSLSSSHSISCDRSLPWWSELAVRFRVNAWKQKFKNPLSEPECTSPEQVLFLEHTCQGGSAAINNPTPQPV